MKIECVFKTIETPIGEQKFWRIVAKVGERWMAYETPPLQDEWSIASRKALADGILAIPVSDKVAFE